MLVEGAPGDQEYIILLGLICGILSLSSSKCNSFEFCPISTSMGVTAHGLENLINFQSLIKRLVKLREINIIRWFSTARDI